MICLKKYQPINTHKQKHQAMNSAKQLFCTWLLSDFSENWSDMEFKNHVLHTVTFYLWNTSVHIFFTKPSTIVLPYFTDYKDKLSLQRSDTFVLYEIMCSFFYFKTAVWKDNMVKYRYLLVESIWSNWIQAFLRNSQSTISIGSRMRLHLILIVIHQITHFI